MCGEGSFLRGLKLIRRESGMTQTRTERTFLRSLDRERRKSSEAGSATAEVFGFHVPFENLFSFVFDPSGSEVGSETENSIS